MIERAQETSTNASFGADVQRDPGKRSIALLGIALFTLCAGWLRVAEMGPLSDDWPLLGILFWDPEHGAVDALTYHLRSSWEWRPMRAVEASLLLAGHAVHGVAGAYFTIGLTMAAVGIVTTLLFARRWPFGASFAVGLAVALFPPDTTHPWAIMLVARLGLLCCLGALWAFARGWTLASFALLLLALLSYEQVFFCFALAPWLKDGGTRRSALRASALLAISLGVYAVCRFVLFPTDDPKARVFEQLTLQDIVISNLTACRDVLGAALAHWPVRSAGLALEPKARGWTLAAMALLGVSAWLWTSRGSRSRQPPVLLRDVVWGAAALLAPCALAFIRPPTTDLGVSSRGNLSFALGASALFCGVCLLGIRMLPPTARRAVTPLLLAMGLGLVIGARVELSDRYIAASKAQRHVLGTVVAGLGPLPSGTFVVILNAPPASTEGDVPAILGGFGWDLAYAFRFIYQGEVAGALASHRDQLVEIMDQVKATQAIGRAVPLEHVALFDYATGVVTWVLAPPSPSTPRLVPGGPAFDLIGR